MPWPSQAYRYLAFESSTSCEVQTARYCEVHRANTRYILDDHNTTSMSAAVATPRPKHLPLPPSMAQPYGAWARFSPEVPSPPPSPPQKTKVSPESSLGNPLDSKLKAWDASGFELGQFRLVHILSGPFTNNLTRQSDRTGYKNIVQEAKQCRTSTPGQDHPIRAQVARWFPGP